MTMLKIEPVSWQDDAEILTAIRHRVFVDEQHVPIELEIDEHDPQAQHWLASLGDTAVGTVRLLSDGHIGRMAVLADYRGKHIGQDMLDTVIASAKAQQFPLLRLAAQQHAIGFYRKAGFKIYGEPFMDAGIPHVSMELRLDTAAKSTPEHQDFSALALDICQQARRQVRIFSLSLNEAIYSEDDLSVALSALARRHRNSEVRLLICDDRPLREVRHPLVELSRRLSAVDIRLARVELQQELREYFLVGDNGHFAAYTRHGQSGLRSGVDKRAAAREYIEQFDRIWQVSRPSPWLKRLY